MIAEIDLKTHARWIRDLDLLNIYSYDDFIYNLFKFSGIPNRLRPFEYKEIFEKNGWGNITISLLLKVDIEYLEKVNDSFELKILKPFKLNGLSQYYSLRYKSLIPILVVMQVI